MARRLSIGIGGIPAFRRKRRKNMDNRHFGRQWSSFVTATARCSLIGVTGCAAGQTQPLRQQDPDLSDLGQKPDSTLILMQAV
ncbi:hypothetical protein [Paracoccus pacificus]|uniref:Uncharacterized protein n=1 Tax=Paracoccus pacificus TaxID=1463598 RepID=A0ABW4R4T4_9RHOB